MVTPLAAAVWGTRHHWPMPDRTTTSLPTATARETLGVLAGVSRGQGRVLYTSSIAGDMPAPFLAVYGASKAFDLSFAEAVRNELRDTGVSITVLQPGPTDTNFFARAGMEDTKVAAGKKDDPAEVAKQGFDALMAGKDHVVAGSMKNRLQDAAAQVLSEPAKAAMHRRETEPGSARK